MTSDPGGTLPASDQPFNERRRAPRYSVSWSVGLFDPIYGVNARASAVDLSLSGCRLVDVTEPVEPNTIIRIQLQRQSETLELWARVVRFADHRGLGLMFLLARPEEEGILIRWIEEEFGASGH